MEDNHLETPASSVIFAGILTLVLSTSLAAVLIKLRRTKCTKNENTEAESVKEEVEKLDETVYPGGHVTVFYGSQTGTAGSFSRDLEREGETNGFKVQAVDLEETEEVDGGVSAVLLNKNTRNQNNRNTAIFLMATYGEGEPTDNAAHFISFLKKHTDTSSLDENSTHTEEKKGEEGEDPYSIDLSRLDYAVFGLGNTQYEQYNAMGKYVDTTLEKLGARRIIKLGLGDDDGDLEADFEKWKDNELWPLLQTKFIGKVGPLALNSAENKTATLPACQYEVEYVEKEAKADNILMERVNPSCRHYFTAKDCPVLKKKELRPSCDEGSTLHIELDISQAGNELKYKTADNLGVLPVNDEKVVESVAKALKYDLDATFRLKAAPGHEEKCLALFPNPCTVREFLSRYCDLTMAPRRSDLKQLSEYATSDICKKALLRMSSKEGKVEYKQKIIDSKIGLVDILSRLCPSIEMPLEHFVLVCPRLIPRYYTISSSSSVHPSSIHITASVLREERKDGSLFKGLCTNYLADVEVKGKVRVFSKESSFQLPSNPEDPIIMIGPGTGIAPMRALLQERSFLVKTHGINIGPNILYFGCRRKNLDYIYSDELESYQKDGLLSELHLAFSREQNKKVYVQNILAENGEETWHLISKRNAHIYVCGGVQMGSDVSACLRKIISEFGSLNSEDAKMYMEQLSSSGRLIQE
eukprot:CAMPEP_0184856330 /NCGR_PEP_ID=MMETSP0580-20130426/1518_1 /TAXON_ID=1118495 /ORGANISM="Dactyliosolen fragilissimus" /LENGTH=697 /DNA_ID=CAMNT_0027351307 /DNA_START=30 /DNA_END=2120 /DNA_ORIENTATION=+